MNKEFYHLKKVLIKAICLNYVVIIGSLRCIGQRLTTDGGCGDCRYFHSPTTLSLMHGYPLHYPLHIITKPFLSNEGWDKKWKQFKLFAIRLRNNDIPPLLQRHFFPGIFSFAIECNIYETDSTLGPIKKIREGLRYQIR